mgnify:CR=1 FL=1
MPALSNKAVIGVSFKLYLSRGETRDWCRRAGDIARAHPAVAGGDIELVIFPTLPAMETSMAAVGEVPVAFGAQDLFWEDRGAYTGAISGADLADMGARYAEIGHAERRAVFGETDGVIARKVAAAVRSGLTPWLCIGEPEAGDAETAAAFCLAQLEASLAALDTATDLVVAYEPVWAIGQAEAADPAHIRHVAQALAARLADDSRITHARVVYGGSAQVGTLATLHGAVDGLFLGRFAHDTTAFAAMLDEAAAMIAD